MTMDLMTQAMRLFSFFLLVMFVPPTMVSAFRGHPIAGLQFAIIATAATGLFSHVILGISVR